MDPFEACVRTAPYSCVQRYKDELLKLGANFDSFKREASEVVEDLVSGGIPRMAARDVYGAVAETIAKRGVPMAVFWDLENLPVPAACTGRYVASRLKTVLADHGDLVEFRGYASIGLNNIPEEKRSDLQLSGCHLVDCPHNGRKEVADKMIIVDAMDFVNERPNGAVLCFITGDTDYAYLLSRLQRRPNCRTIVISKGTVDSMLHVSCTVKLRWETDILQLVEASVKLVVSNVEGAPPGFSRPVVHSPAASTNVPTSYASATNSLTSVMGAPPVTSTPSATTDLLSSRLGSSPAFRLDESKEMMRHAFLRAPDASRIGSGCLKSFVGNFLKQNYDERFPNREVVKDFLAFAIEHGIVVESGEREYKLLTFPGTAPMAIARYSSPITESTLPPIPVALMPKRALEAASISPIIIFIPWTQCPSKSDLPEWTFVQSYEYMAILMYKSKVAALSATDKCPPLRRGILVDWRRVPTANAALTNLVRAARPIFSSTTVEALANCDVCDARQLKSDMYKSAKGVVCDSCYVLSEEEAATACQRVSELLEVMAENDDISVHENMLRTLVVRKHSEDCASKKQAALWITSAVSVGVAVQIRKDKNVFVCLPRNYREANLPFPPDDMDTSAEEAHVLDLLWESYGAWLGRAVVGKSLAAKFGRMSTAYMRTKVFLNAHTRKKIFVAKSEYGHTVALTEQDANDALRFLLPPSLVAATPEPESVSSVADGIDATSNSSSDDDSFD